LLTHLAFSNLPAVAPGRPHPEPRGHGCSAIAGAPVPFRSCDATKPRRAGTLRRAESNAGSGPGILPIAMVLLAGGAGGGSTGWSVPRLELMDSRREMGVKLGARSISFERPFDRLMLFAVASFRHILNQFYICSWLSLVNPRSVEAITGQQVSRISTGSGFTRGVDCLKVLFRLLPPC